MRNQFYGDRADIWKWSLLLELAGNSRHIYQVAMLTPDKGEHRLAKGDPGQCNKLVRDFFELERRNGTHDIYRVERLLQGQITVLNPSGCGLESYSNARRTSYFNNVLVAIQAHSARKIVFLDPDNGVEVKKPTDGHVRFEDIARVWNCLNIGDFLVIYQHHPRDFTMRNDRALVDQFLRHKKEQIGKAIGVAPDDISERTYDSVSFFWLSRNALSLIAAQTQSSQFGLPPLPVLRSTTVFGRKICYYDIGSGPTLVLVHGLGGDADQWAFCFQALSATHRVVALELLGFGRSDKPNITHRIAGFVEVLEGFLQALAIGRASLLGHSLGGWIVAAFALQFPDKVDRLVLNDAVGMDSGAIKPPVDLNISTHAHMRAMLESMFYNQAVVNDALVDLAYSLHLERGDGPTIRSVLKIFSSPDEKLDHHISRLKAPTLLLWGEQDALTPLLLARNFERSIPGSRLEVIPQCGHFPALEKPAEFTRRVLEFLQ